MGKPTSLNSARVARRRLYARFFGFETTWPFSKEVFAKSFKQLIEEALFHTLRWITERLVAKLTP
jgi:hypothetical protein